MINITVPLAPVSEQAEILTRVDGMLSTEAIADVRRGAELELLASLEQSILAKAFRGDLVAHDPNDEPAEELLLRIRSEVAAESGKGLRPSKSRKNSKAKGRTIVSRKRAEVPEDYLASLLRHLKGKASSEMLWQGSDMDIDEFYKQLRDEISRGYIREYADKQTLGAISAS